MTRAPVLAGILFMLAACSQVLGLDADDESSDSSRGSVGSTDSGDQDAATASSGGTSSGTGGPSSSSSGAVGSSSSSSGSPAPLLDEPACGAMGAYAASTWPMAGRCPTRPAAARVPALQAPHIRHRVDYGPDDSFVSGAALGADETAYAVVALRGSSGFDYAVVGIRAGEEVTRCTLPSGPASTPTVAADGTLYVRTRRELVACDPAESMASWTRDLGSGGAAPLILADGAIVTTAGHDIVRTTPDGSPAGTWSLGSTSQAPSFRGELTLSETGTLYAVASTAPATYGGLLVAYRSNGTQAFEPTSLSAPGEGAPSMTRQGTVLVRSYGTLGTYTHDGALLAQRSTMHAGSGTFAARSGDTFLLSDDGPPGAFRYELVEGTLDDLELGGKTGDFSVTGDGSAIYVRNDLVGDPLARLVALESCTAEGEPVWSVTLDPDNPSSLHAPALGADGAAYVAVARTLYEIGD